MARPNRFNARGVQDVARRQAQAQEGTPYHATPAEQRWGAQAARPDHTRRQEPQVTIPTGWLNNTTINTQWLTQRLQDTIAIPDRIWQQEIRATPARAAREVNLNDLRINPAAIPARDPELERREQLRREFRERELTEEGRAENEAIRQRRRNFNKGKRSKDKAKGLSQVLYAAMAMNRDYTGKVFCYKVMEGTGIWYVNNLPVAEVDIQTCKLKRLRMPKVGLLPVPYDNVFNKTRFLWRQLGLKAVRYKNTTIVHTGLTGSVLSPGEDWVINPAYVKSFIEHPMKEMTPQYLFKEFSEHYATDPNQFRTKPVAWVNYKGTLLSGSYHLGDGKWLSFNNPPQDTSGSSEQGNADSQ